MTSLAWIHLALFLGLLLLLAWPLSRWLTKVAQGRLPRWMQAVEGVVYRAAGIQPGEQVGVFALDGEEGVARLGVLQARLRQPARVLAEAVARRVRETQAPAFAVVPEHVHETRAQLIGAAHAGAHQGGRFQRVGDQQQRLPRLQVHAHAQHGVGVAGEFLLEIRQHSFPPGTRLVRGFSRMDADSNGWRVTQVTSPA